MRGDSRPRKESANPSRTFRVQLDVGFERVRTLLSREIAEADVVLDIECDEPAPRIELRGSRNDRGDVILQVIDNGPGIAPENLDSIFVPFFTTKRNGTGVGLSVSRQIVQANQGFISVRSAPGEGCVFTLKFSSPHPAAIDGHVT